MAEILIAGCGYVGRALALRLAASGHGVYALRRSAASPPAGVRPLRADLSDPASLADLPAKLDAVVYAASPGSRCEAAYRQTYPVGLGNLLEALASDGPGPKRVLFTSSTAVYGQSEGEWVDEASAAVASGFSGRALREAEARLAGTAAAGGIGIAVRFGGIYGPGRTGGLERLRSGALRCRGGVHHFANRIHRDDAAGALQHLLFLADPAGLYLGVDAEPACDCSVSHWLRERGLTAVVPSEEVAPDARGAAAGKRCRSARLVASGYRFRYPSFREGYAELAPAR